MNVTQSVEKDSVPWSVIRKQANSIGIPAWKLAEDLGIHDLTERPKQAFSSRIFDRDR